jgi:lipopolysaccharide biosynthesis glycosyltransferase
MQTASHFIGIELKAELCSDIFVKVYNYLTENNIENSLLFQNPLSPHITIYYLEKDIDLDSKKEIKKYLKEFKIESNLSLSLSHITFELLL